MDNKGEVILSVGALKVQRHYDLSSSTSPCMDLCTSLWPESLSRHQVAEPQKCGFCVDPRVQEEDFTASLKILFALMLLVCTVLNNITMVNVRQELYWIVICAVFILVPITWKIAMTMREQTRMVAALQKTVNVKTVAVRIQHV